jgi:hypothetical protein
MKKKSLIPRSVAVILAAFLLALLAAPTPASAARAAGEVVGIDLARYEIEIRREDGSRVRVEVRTGTSMKRNDRSAELEHLTLFDRAEIEFRPKDHVAKLVRSQGPAFQNLSGRLGEFEIEKGRVRIGNRTVILEGATRVSRNGEDSSLSEFRREDRLQVHLRSGGRRAADILGSGLSVDEVHGSIESMTGDDVTIAPVNGTSSIVLHLTANSVIEIDGVKGTKSQLAVGQAVEAHFDPAHRQISVIEVDAEDLGEDAHVHGLVVSVNVAAGRVTIALAGGGAGAPNLVLQVTPSTEIEVNDRRGGLNDIAAGMPIEAEYHLDTLNAKELKAGTGQDDNNDIGEDAHITGTISGVDGVGSTVTIAPNGGGASVTLKVMAGTKIEVGGEAGTLADIKTGEPVKAEYEKVSLEARELEVGVDDNPNGPGDPAEDVHVDGTVAAVDLGAGTVTIAPGGGAAVTLKVTPATEIEIDGEPGTISGIQTGEPARAQYRVATLEATEIKVGQDSHGGGGN